MRRQDIWSRARRDSSGCLVWQGSRSTAGYGTVNIGRHTYRYAHRIAYEAVHGTIPSGRVVMHTCDNPPCIEPNHLRLGTHTENAADMVAKGRARPGAPRRGSEWLPPRFTPADADRVRARYASGGMTYRQLAEEEGVAIVTVARLVRGATYSEKSR